MVQLKVLSGKKAGTTWLARRFPIRIGRSKAADLQLEDDGVWDQHLQLDFKPAEGIVLTAHPSAPATVNGHPQPQTVLRNGDGIRIGALQMQFWLSPTRQAGLRWREGLTWTAVAILSLGQVALIYLLR
ncbi:MAG TPA: FHA domain-containing protein [Verrucomicrobiota bacterium]|nr:FHA domain-containing protein [Verrucomicrobiota bacterium]HRR65746.1 FHA domain-containing protein [Candidatus Paceibacterota bacterium]HOF72076.1 FHA domain-containing protein [Verrucomicrobiota bacterium]HOM46626.1 FHA domain-containing protein [Verrucomicrobiota bacterium]HOQ57096.1 FHA domain-containing protein [Verrucomicrobiota bacterium]